MDSSDGRARQPVRSRQTILNAAPKALKDKEDCLKLVRILLLILIVGVALAVPLFWFFPASWAVPMIERRAHALRLEDVGGTAWDGHAGRVIDAKGASIGALRWTLGREVVLGRTHLQADFQGPIGHFAGRFEQEAADISQWSEVTFELDAGVGPGSPALPPVLRDLAPGGRLQGRIPVAQLQGNWPVSMRGDIYWNDASVGAKGGRVALGNLHVRLDSEAVVLRATLDDDDQGPLEAHGSLNASPLGWRLDATLRPRTDSPALRGVLARFGTPAADGGIHIRQQAGLAAMGAR
jgi:general secretion pathway protein N